MSLAGGDGVDAAFRAARPRRRLTCRALMARAGMDRVVVTVRVEARDVVARLEPPPDAGEPSALWMERLASLMRGEGGELRCCLPGTLEEASGALV